MEKRAIITISSIQGNKEDDSIQVVTPGSFYSKDDCYYAVYEETEISGMEGTTTTLKIGPEELILLREGTTNANMHFVNGKNNLSMYDTPYGTLKMEVNTKNIDIDINEKGGNIAVKYDMNISGQMVPETSLDINIKVQ
ncbi:hypothetical protein CPAST_c02550 [Clostridium pasteurianum DSM 525 = ATCC 6013]|uniref:Calycin-like domain-containing protein n=1 Tax=Clostridium pasteurianum DSM 525 = ATCC 6013 TaxID=1262449 RepID=A0A0H3J600_CLOPA|nr:DUF1934 domain-containing protein [Clostridium pasteurianum]AJA46355.1 hypothetical protein CPAST_c02550 [Clostridium pasteurianum DSM 525 = ATCC 6013]AJA50343.1 hypothetical protein CLPA_c02550 [Clostridium pasteurianum DSM 525 = ATCC 6013]AOZ73794.1 hypothetical protein AQ983_01230 [Clostridium pasteurianum DSM 525 = ATCC 6013]AOZ77591.1 hypothetical protein AQ984_01230 [Clostridium pasteurianum]ELP60932.1 hypothetical protein F502_00695 [Clostridium pasteurianum DSM 525 = ATCC 6013]